MYAGNNHSLTAPCKTKLKKKKASNAAKAALDPNPNHPRSARRKILESFGSRQSNEILPTMLDKAGQALLPSFHDQDDLTRKIKDPWLASIAPKRHHCLLPRYMNNTRKKRKKRGQNRDAAVPTHCKSPMNAKDIRRADVLASEIPLS